ncbi:VirB4 family type IV secretion/conjugal transfer ATPase [Paracoccus beibuensis]|uniref:VirB4 family type IV secretion/conjugal transfer ATPase n=1 Tax=Paracoccus beibuensis TaxID=547602 RepID=UPI00223F4281|nr:type IV secretion system protein B4 [Paracoccus beibuensis]
MFSARSLPVSERARRHVPRSPQVYAEMPYALEIDDHTVRTRENALMMSLEIGGIDGITASDRDILDLARSFAAILDGLDDRFSFYIHRLMRPAALSLKPLYGEGFAQDVETAWRGHLSGRALREFMLVLTVVRNKRVPLRVPLFAKAAGRLLDRNTAERLGELREVVSILETSLPLKGHRLRISDGTLLGFYAAIGTGFYRPEYRGLHTLIAEDVSLISLRFRGPVAEFRDGFDGPRHAAVLSVWRNAQQTWPGMLDALDAGTDTVISHSYTPVAMNKVSELAKRRIQQMEAAGDLVGSIAADLHETYDDVESGRCGFGEHQLTITVFADSPAALEARVSQVRGVAEQARIKLVRCNDTMAATYFAAHPGNRDYEIWNPLTKSINFADMASFHMASAGTRAEAVPWHTPLTVFQTVTGAAHRFSFHAPGDPKAEPTIGHTLCLGPSGSGKSSLMAFLVAQAQRTGARMILFDKDQALRMAITALGGRYAAIRAGQPTGLNPLLTELGPRGEAWLLGWLARLVECDGPRLTPQQAEALKGAVRQNGQAPEALRTFAHFGDLIGDVGDNRDLAMKLAEWAPEGRYAWVFGDADQPVIDLTAPVTGIDLTEILSMATERTAVLSYIFRRLELLFEEKRPTLLVIDEASTVFDDTFFACWLPKWLVTVRKLNVVVVLLTQFPSQIRDSHSGAIIQALPNQMIFPNRAADVADYEGFGFTDNELHFILTGRTAERQALWRHGDGSTILDVDLSPLGSLLTALGGGEAGHRAFGADYATRPHFWRTHDA